jgi:hypothetical protein
MAQEADTLLSEFNEALESGERRFRCPIPARYNPDCFSFSLVTLAAQAEPTATGEYVDLTNDLQTAVQKRFAVEREFREYKRKVQTELDEKARLERILRDNGIDF